MVVPEFDVPWSELVPLPLEEWFELAGRLPAPVERIDLPRRSVNRRWLVERFPEECAERPDDHPDVVVSQLLKDRFLAAWSVRLGWPVEDLVIASPVANAYADASSGRRCDKVLAVLAVSTVRSKKLVGQEVMAVRHRERAAGLHSNGRRVDRVAKVSHEDHLEIRRRAVAALRAAGVRLGRCKGSEKARTPGAMLDELLARVSRDAHPDQAAGVVAAVFAEAFAAVDPAMVFDAPEEL